MRHLYRFLWATCVAILVGAVSRFEEGGLGDIVNYTIILISFGLVFLFQYRENFLSQKNSDRFMGMAVGLIMALVIIHHIEPILRNLGLNSKLLSVALYLVAGMIFGGVGANSNLFLSGFSLPKGNSEKPANPARSGARPKLLDTSVIIDGRIMDIAETKFVEGPFIVPNYVLREIQLISDSPDAIKRNRGRRGLDMLNKLQERKDIEVKISYKDYTDIREVDAKLVRMAREIDAFLITNDFNLNKVAVLQDVEVLNLNTLTTALKPVVLHGEHIPIDILCEGKDENQGIGYMEDGTMVVVENGGHLINKKVEVIVTSVIQTAGGKMIFTKAGNVIQNVEADPRDNYDNTRRDKRGGGSNNNRRHEQRERTERRPVRSKY